MIVNKGNVYVLSTRNTTYMFRILETGQPEHLYYGAGLGDYSQVPEEDLLQDAETLGEKREFQAGNMITYDQEHLALTLEDLRLEMSARGKGDIREPFVEIIHEDGSRTSDFLFEKAAIDKEVPDLGELPTSYTEKEGEAEHLILTFRDRSYPVSLELHYWIYADSDIISRSAKVINHGEESIRLERLMSTMLDLEDAGYTFTSFTGAWAREMNRQDMAVTAGRVVNASVCGASSNRSNPFVMLSKPETNEASGDCYAFNLVYSGNHYEAAEVNAFGKTRVLTGINPDGFSWLLEAGESFTAPEAVMTYSDKGFTGVSLAMQRFVKEHIVRGVWKNKLRPILLNSWEAAYFKIDEAKLLKLAKAGSEAGMELFVMDDGWFGTRDDDTQSLGDWDVNKKKLPGGLKGIADKVHSLGMDFGIWIEPEMVNVNSELYRQHPDWAMGIPGKPHSEGRNQRILDMANPEVVEYMTEKMTEVISSADINYVKWDMNRIMSDVYSPFLPASKQGEAAHRYILGFFRMAKALTRRFPEVLFEGCASGGCRFDLGMLSYFPQIWASDDTDALQRTRIQEGYSYGYPMSVVSAHVSSCPNHQTLRDTPLDTRFNVAAFGVLGYELNLCDLSKKELDEIKKQVALYKEWREVLQRGDFYRGRSGNVHEWTCVSPDGEKAVGMILQEQVLPNTQFEQYKARGLCQEKRYHLYNIEVKRDLRSFGDLVNTQAPIHVKQGSMLHNMIAKFVTMPGEQEEVNASGAILMKSGVKLSQAFSGTGYNEKTRYFADYCSRLYFMEE